MITIVITFSHSRHFVLFLCSSNLHAVSCLLAIAQLGVRGADSDISKGYFK